MFSSLPTQGAPRKNVKNDNDLKTSPRQAAWKNSPEKGSETGNICGELTFFTQAVTFFCLMKAAGQFRNFVIIWRLVVFLNNSQRFDSISGMLSMTLVWNQRTTLENEGGGKKGFQGGAIGARQSTSWGAETLCRARPLTAPDGARASPGLLDLTNTNTSSDAVLYVRHVFLH